MVAFSALSLKEIVPCFFTLTPNSRHWSLLHKKLPYIFSVFLILTSHISVPNLHIFYAFLPVPIITEPFFTVHRLCKTDAFRHWLFTWGFSQYRVYEIASCLSQLAMNKRYKRSCLFQTTSEPDQTSGNLLTRCKNFVVYEIIFIRTRVSGLFWKEKIPSVIITKIIFANLIFFLKMRKKLCYSFISIWFIN